MSFDQFETSDSSGSAVELYLIRIGSESFAYTNYTQILEHAGDTYLPAPITRSKPTVSPSKPGAEIELFLPTDDEITSPVANAWVARAPEGLTTLTIFKRHMEDPAEEVVTFYAGDVTGTRYARNTKQVVLKSKSLDDLIAKQGPRQDNGSSCGHQLYDGQCQVNPVLFTQTAQVTAVSANGLVYTIPGLSAPTAAWKSGRMKLNGGFDERMIIDQSGDDFTIKTPVPGIQSGDLVDLSEGCARNMDACVLFANIENYGGAPYRPIENPFEVGLEGV